MNNLKHTYSQIFFFETYMMSVLASILPK